MKNTKKTIMFIIAGVVILFVANKIIKTGKARYVNIGTTSIVQSVVIDDDEVQYITDGKTIKKYIPPEGNVTVHTKKIEDTTEALGKLQGAITANVQRETINPVNNDSTATDSVFPPAAITASIDSIKQILQDPIKHGLITITTKGLCLRPIAGIGWNGEIDGYLGVKIAYWNKYGIAVGSTTRQAGIGITRRLNFIPYTHNTEAMIFYGMPYNKNDGNIFAGITVGL